MVPWTPKPIVVGSERLLAALIALRRDPGPESFKLDRVTVASRCVVDPRAPVMPIDSGASEAAETDTAVTAPAASRALNSLRIRDSFPPWTPTKPPLQRREA